MLEPDETGALTGRSAYLKFLENEIVAQRAFLKMHRNARPRGTHEGAPPRRLFASSALQPSVSVSRRREQAVPRPYTMDAMVRRHVPAVHAAASTARIPRGGRLPHRRAQSARG